MAGKNGGRLTRAEAEGVSYKLPDGEQSKVFEEGFRPLRDEPGALLEMLYLAQESFGCLPKAVLGWIAQEAKIPRSEVFSTATFYSLFSLKPEAKYIIRACDCLSCYLNGGKVVLAAIRDAAGIPEGKTASEDSLFSLETVSCLGLCDQSPAIMINQDRYGLLDADKARHIIASLRSKESIKEGNQ